MSREKKLYTLQNIVAECCCEWEVFCGNVLDTDGREKFTEKLDRCNSREELESLVNEYI